MSPRSPSCLLAVFAVLAIISPNSSCSSYSWNEWSVSLFSFTTKTTHSRPQVFSVNGALTCRRPHFWRHFLVKHKILPNLVISNWLWWIRRVLLGSQNRENILNEWIIINNSLSVEQAMGYVTVTSVALIIFHLHIRSAKCFFHG